MITKVETFFGYLMLIGFIGTTIIAFSAGFIEGYNNIEITSDTAVNIFDSLWKISTLLFFITKGLKKWFK